MLKRFWKHGIISALALMLAVAGCEHAGPSPTEPLGEPRADLIGWLFGGSEDGGSDAEYTHLEGRPPALPGDHSVAVAQVFGAGGGELHLAGHTLRVPPGTVLEPTLFTLAVPKNGYVEVDLQATLLNEVWGLITGLLDGAGELVGVDFQEPVTLEMTYAWAENAPDDPRRLQILHLLDEDGGHDGAHDLVETGRELDSTHKVLRVKLEHFSRYCMAF